MRKCHRWDRHTDFSYPTFAGFLTDEIINASTSWQNGFVQRRSVPAFRDTHQKWSVVIPASSLVFWQTSFFVLYTKFLDSYRLFIQSMSLGNTNNAYDTVDLESYPLLALHEGGNFGANVTDMILQTRNTAHFSTCTPFVSVPNDTENCVGTFDQIFESLVIGDPSLIDLHIQYIFSVTNLYNIAAVRCSLSRITRIGRAYTSNR